MTTYDLPTIGANNALGFAIKVRLYSEFAGLTVPTKQTITEIPNVIETFWDKIGSATIGNASIDVTDDCTTYTEGFWFKVLQGDFRLRFIVDTGGDGTFLFYGTIGDEETTWEGYWNDEATYVRKGTIRLLSAEKILFDTVTSDWVTELLTTDATTISYTADYYPATVSSLQQMFAAMLSVSGLNSGYDLADVSCLFDAALLDLYFTHSGTDYTFNELIFILETWDVGGGAKIVQEYWDNADSNGFALTLSTLQAMIPALLGNWGLTMRMSYNTTTERHLIQIMQGGRMTSGISVLGKFVSEKITNRGPYFGDAARISENSSIGFTNIAYDSNKYTQSSILFGSFSTPADYDQTLLWSRSNVVLGAPGNQYSRYYFVGTSSAYYALVAGDVINVWRYDLGAYMPVQAQLDTGMVYAMCGLMFGKITRYTWSGTPWVKTSLPRRQIIRTYGECIDSLNVITIMCRTSIDLGDGANTYFANKVTMLPTQNRMEIEWIQE